MKKWYTVINNNFFVIILLIFSVNCFAKAPVARIKSMSGNVFILKDGKIIEARVGMTVDDFSDVITEDRGRVSLVDYYDHSFHLSNSSHLKFRGHSVEIIGGYLWIQTYRGKNGFLIETANSSIEYFDGEAIVSFDPIKAKTQVVSIKGTFKLSNIHDRFAYTEVREGSFSFVNKSFKNGVPRRSTPIGYKSFLKIRSLFSFVKEMQAGENIIAVKRQQYIDRRQSRSVASIQKENNIFEESFRNNNFTKVNYKNNFNPKVTRSIAKRKYGQGKMLILKDQFVAEQNHRSRNLEQLYVEKLMALKQPKKKVLQFSYNRKKSNVKIKIFRSSFSKQDFGSTNGSRSIASIPKENLNHRQKIFKRYFKKTRKPASVVSRKKVNKKIKNNQNSFDASLVNQYKSQRRHASEVNSLIDQLNSVKIDNTKNY